MCGIAGRFHPEFLPVDEGWHERAAARLEHRGPDGSGHYVDERCELVHRRLALIDLSPTGNQPMANEDGSVFVVFNGEIYNHAGLRRELKAQGHRFRGTSDTEVLVHLYEEMGERLVDRITGMFAFAIYDRRQHQLLLARDRYGIKPLYYAIFKGQIVFASEIKALLALQDFRPTLDRQACYDYLGLTYVPEPATGFKEIQTLPVGTTLLASPNGRRLTPFYRVQSEPDSVQTMSSVVDSAAETLLQSVQSQMVADVPVAALLSGGIDSSLVVAAYQRVSSTPPRTFNVRFPDAAFDETVRAKEVSAACGTEHETIDISDWAVEPEAIARLFEHFDQPFADTSLVPMYWVARAIRQRGIICALSGDGGDEVFGGYPCFWQANRLVQLMRLPGWLQATTVAGGQRLANWTTDWGRQVARAAEISLGGREDSAVLIAGLANYLSEKQKGELLKGGAAEFDPASRHFDGYVPRAATSVEELSRRMTEKLFAVSLPSNMLHRADMMSMLASIETRVPLLDENVVELGLRLPHHLKTDGNHGKLALRTLAAQWLPDTVARHPKQGFSIPLDRLVTGRFHEMLSDLLLGTGSRIAGFLNVPLVRSWIDLFKQAKYSRPTGTISRDGLYHRIFILFALELWMRQHKLSW